MKRYGDRRLSVSSMNANSLKQNIIVINEMCSSWLPPFCKQNLLFILFIPSFIQPRWQIRRTYFFNHYNALF